MARNVSRPLSRDEQVRVAAAQPKLVAASVTERPVKVDYVKNNGSKGSATGKVMFFNGEASTYSVTIDSRSTKGRETTVNVRNVFHVWEV